MLKTCVIFVIQPFKILIEHLNKFENNPMNINKFSTHLKFKTHCYLTLQNSVKTLFKHCCSTLSQDF